MIKFETVYREPETATLRLYELLSERTPAQSISHKAMPTYLEHTQFVMSHPYFSWYLIQSDAGEIVGSIYLTHQREVGISVFRKHRRQGYAEQAIRLLMSINPGRFLANIAPENAASAALFAKFGARHIQDTYEF